MATQYTVLLKPQFSEAVYLGDVDAYDFAETVRIFEDAGCAVFAPEEMDALPLAANPADLRNLQADSNALLRNSLNGPLQAMSESVALLANTITIGKSPNRSVGNKISYPITKSQLERVDLQEAAVNLAIFSVGTRKLMSDEMIEMLQTSQFIDVAKLIDQSSNPRATKGLVQKITTRFVDWMISANAKLEKSKLPASLGIGAPSDVEGWNYGPTDGSEGLQLLPNATLIRRTESDQISFYDAIVDLDVGLFGKDSREWVFKDLILTTLDNLGNTQKMTCCPQASNPCRMVCLADGVQRSASRKDVLGREFENIQDPTLDEVSYNRMSLGCRHTAFLSNPYYFMRILLEAIHKRALSYPNKLNRYNEAVEPEYRLDDRAKAEYLKKVPPSVRLNVLSDYVWELICPDLFEVFGGRSTFNGTRMPYVQFYDYTKIPGRWPKEIRDLVADHLGMPPNNSHMLPENYHITFSFSGTKGSLNLSEIQNWAGQNTTFVFQTTAITSGEIKQLLDPQFAAYRNLIEASDLSESEKLALERNVLRYLKGFRSQLMNALKKAKIKGLKIRSKGTPLKVPLLPSTHMGYQVINGDFSDLRFLDAWQKKNPEDAAVVGLNWKVPHGARFKIEGLQEYRLQTKSKAKTDTVAYTPFSGVAYPELSGGRSSQEAGARFSQFRLGMSISINLEDLEEPVHIYMIPKETGASGIRSMITDVARGVGGGDVSFTFATESGSTLNEAQESGTAEVLDAMNAFVKDWNRSK